MSMREGGSIVYVLLLEPAYKNKYPPIGLMKIANIYVNLKKLLNREVDLVEEGTLLPFAVESANRDKKLIYERAS